MNKILRELFPKTEPNVLISDVSSEEIRDTLNKVKALFFVANVNQENNKKAKNKDNFLILPESEILPHIQYTICVSSADDPNMIPTLSNAAQMLDIPLVLLFSKPKEAYGSTRWVNIVKRSRSNLNVFLSEEISESWNLKNTPSTIGDYTNSDIFTDILKKVEQDYYK
jgi:hypothetical protein